MVVVVVVVIIIIVVIVVVVIVVVYSGSVFLLVLRNRLTRSCYHTDYQMVA